LFARHVLFLGDGSSLRAVVSRTARRNLKGADRKSLEIDERSGDEHGAAKTYHNLSAVANARKDFESAEKWLWKSIHIKEKLRDRIGVAHSYQQLGIVAGTRQDLDAAEQWFFKSLEIFEKLTDEIGAAHCYTHLGWLAYEQCDYEASKKWYEKALELYVKRGVTDWAAKIRTALAQPRFI
jgi:tetratricopeptide (TPR) repeat protein